MPLLLGLLACGGVNDETVLAELRVWAMVAEPPEIGPGQSTTVTSHVIDPGASGFEVLTWACTDLGEGCLEPMLGVPWYAAGDPETGTPGSSGRFAATFSAPMLGGGPPDGSVMDTAAPDTAAADTATPDTGSTDTGSATVPPAAPLTGLYTLACVPGTCPAIARAREGALSSEDVADVTALMAGLPIAGTALSTRRLWLGSGLNPHANPTLERLETTRDTDGPPFSAGDRLTLRYRVVGTFGEEPFAYGYALGGGGFDATRYRVDPATGEVALTWVAGESLDPGATLYVVVNDGLGGVALGETALAR